VKKLFQVSVACLPGGSLPGKSWVTRSYKVGAFSAGEAERLGLNFFGAEFPLESLEDYAIFSKPFERKTTLERSTL
jgi:hypothetical protein